MENKTKLKRKVPDKKKKKGNKAIRTITIVLASLAALMLLVVLGGWLLLQHYINKMEYIPDDDVSIVNIDELPSEAFEDDDQFVYVKETLTDEEGNVIGSTYNGVDLDDLSEEERASIEASIALEQSSVLEAQQQASQTPIMSSSDVYNLLLIGVDVRSGAEWNGNSDSMILISINNKKKTINMTSFMRDSYANIPNVGGNKLNRAHALGGGPLLVQTISENYRIAIDNYARVNFYSLMEIVDNIGGIDMDVRADEIPHINNYIKEMAPGKGVAPDSYFLSSPGTFHLNGMQAVAYSRVRYAGNSDFERTERQRKVLMAIFTRLQSSSITEINNFLNSSLPLVAHNIPADRITSLVVNAPSYLSYSVQTSRIPYDGLYSMMGEMLVPDFDATISRLHAAIY